MGEGYWVKRIDEIPRVDMDPGEADWHPLQHHFALRAFGLNAFVAHEEGVELISEHDEVASGQEEVYLVTSGTGRFTLDGETIDAQAGTAVIVRDPRVKRRAVAAESETTVIAIGAAPRGEFKSTWKSSHFESVLQV